MFSKLYTVVLVSFLTSAALAASPKYYLSLTGAKSGALYHNNVTSFVNVVPILGFNFSATTPRDIATGIATGRATFTPVTLYKEMDISSPLLMQILTTNEIFQATITAVEPATDGHLATTLSWKLTNGALDGVSYSAGATELVETIAMAFQKMEIDATAGGSTMATTFDTAAPVA